MNFESWNTNQITTIDQVINLLEEIIVESEISNNSSGYFAALYQKVTIRVKLGIAAGSFVDGQRMEQLDIAFAKRYLDAWLAWRKNEPVTESWRKAFELSTEYWPIVLQHMLMGMNAHINLDLGIAAAEVSKGKELADLENDFNQINNILSSMVHEIQDDLSAVWPALKYILKWSGKIDDYLVDFSMKLARNGAWKFANSLYGMSGLTLETANSERDLRVAAKTHVVLKPGLIASLTLRIIRLTEFGTVQDKIRKIKYKTKIISS